jgi:hypothetical protein
MERHHSVELQMNAAAPVQPCTGKITEFWRKSLKSSRRKLGKKTRHGPVTNILLYVQCKNKKRKQ